MPTAPRASPSRSTSSRGPGADVNASRYAVRSSVFTLTLLMPRASRQPAVHRPGRAALQHQRFRRARAIAASRSRSSIGGPVSRRVHCRCSRPAVPRPSRPGTLGPHPEFGESRLARLDGPAVLGARQASHLRLDGDTLRASRHRDPRDQRRIVGQGQGRPVGHDAIHPCLDRPLERHRGRAMIQQDGDRDLRLSPVYRSQAMSAQMFMRHETAAPGISGLRAALPASMTAGGFVEGVTLQPGTAPPAARARASRSTSPVLTCRHRRDVPPPRGPRRGRHVAREDRHSRPGHREPGPHRQRGTPGQQGSHDSASSTPSPRVATSLLVMPPLDRTHAGRTRCPGHLDEPR